MNRVFVAGVAAHPWARWPEKSSLDMAQDVVSRALTDAGLLPADVAAVVSASSRFEGGLGWGLHANELIQSLSENGAAAVNVGGGCAAGGIAVHTAATMIASGQHDVVVALGSEKMPAGFIPRPPGAADNLSDTDYLRWVAIGATNPAYWALEARRRMHVHGTQPEHFARAVQLMRANGARNPLARFRKEIELEDVLDSKMVSDPLHLLEVCAVSDGAAAVVLVSEAIAERLAHKPVAVAGSAIATGRFGDPSVRIPTVAQNPTAGGIATSEVRGAVDQALAAAQLGREDVDIFEFADNSAWHILAWPEQLGYLEDGAADEMVAKGQLGNGRTVFNPSGGFLSFGEATTAQGVLQICELVWQLRGDAGERQVPGAAVGQTAVLGLGSNGASVVLKTVA